MRLKVFLPFLFAFWWPYATISQQITSTVRGEVIDKDFQFPIPGATIAIYNGNNLVGGSASDGAGFYIIKDIPVGRYTVVASFIGYQKISLPNTIVKSGKELVLNIELQESAISMKEVEIFASKRN